MIVTEVDSPVRFGGPSTAYNPTIVEYLAAEIIQHAFRRYLACKPAIKIKRISSSEKVVMNLAADTIIRSFRSLKR